MKTATKTKRTRAPKGTPTDLNLWTLRRTFDGKFEVPNQIEPTSAAGLRRCMKAGLFVVSADRKSLILTEAGVAACALPEVR